MEGRSIIFTPDEMHSAQLKLSQSDLLGRQNFNSEQPSPYPFTHNDGTFFTALLCVIMATAVAATRPPFKSNLAPEPGHNTVLKLKIKQAKLKSEATLKANDTLKTTKTLKPITQLQPSPAPQTKIQSTNITAKPATKTIAKGKVELNMVIPDEWPGYVDTEQGENKHSDVFDQKLRKRLNSPYIEKLNSRRSVVDQGNYVSIYNDTFVSDGAGNCFKVLDNQGEEMWIKAKCRSKNQTFKFGRRTGD